jgi:hypothetical protein
MILFSAENMTADHADCTDTKPDKKIRSVTFCTCQMNALILIMDRSIIRVMGEIRGFNHSLKMTSKRSVRFGSYPPLHASAWVEVGGCEQAMRNTIMR